MKLYLIRHGMTDWNAEKRIQGRTDQPLSAEGIAALRRCRLPAGLAALRWYCSPLKRARQSAEILGISEPVIDANLIEMHWGDWEGEILKLLRKQLGDIMRDNEARGLDFCPPGGESPRRVQQRLIPWLESIAAQGDDCGAVVHKGIVRCIYAMAFGWDMRGESPVDFDWYAAHQFELHKTGHLLPAYSCHSLITSI